MTIGTRWCALCGAEYVAGVLECADCIVPLVDRQPLAVDDVGSEDEEQLAYELDELDNEARLQIDLALSDAGIDHSWDDGSLVVSERDEAVVDQLLDTGGFDHLVDPDAEQVSYDLSDWSDEQRLELREALDATGVAYAFDDNGDLVVEAEAEERVEAILDAVEYPDQLPAGDEGSGDGGDGDGLEASEVMSELFVASDRLMHDPQDHEGVLALVDAAQAAGTLPLPYGFAPAVWNDLVAQARSLADDIAGDADDETVMSKATTLRTTLRQYV